MWWIIPTSTRWRKWTLPSKASYVGAIIAVLGLPTIILSYSELGGRIGKILARQYYEMYVLSQNQRRLKISMANQSDLPIYVMGALFWTDNYLEGDRTNSKINIGVFSDDGRRSPFQISPESSAVLEIDGRSFELDNIEDLRAKSCVAYYREKFLWELAQNQDGGGVFLPHLRIHVRIGEDEALSDPYDVSVDPYLIENIIGSWNEYQLGRPKYVSQLRKPGPRSGCLP